MSDIEHQVALREQHGGKQAVQNGELKEEGSGKEPAWVVPEYVIQSLGDLKDVVEQGEGSNKKPRLE